MFVPCPRTATFGERCTQRTRSAHTKSTRASDTSARSVPMSIASGFSHCASLCVCAWLNVTSRRHQRFCRRHAAHRTLVNRFARESQYNRLELTLHLVDTSPSTALPFQYSGLEATRATHGSGTASITDDSVPLLLQR